MVLSPAWVIGITLFVFFVLALVTYLLWIAETPSCPPGYPTVTGADGVYTISGPPGVGFECSLDGEPFENCPAQPTFADLEPGPHALTVRFKGCPRSEINMTWTVADMGGAVITSGPEATTSQRNATFQFSATGTTVCSTDTEAWRPCTSPVTLTGLSVGTHTFRVRQTSGDVTPATRTWRIVAGTVEGAPTITVGPVGNNTSPQATFAFTSTRGGPYECSLDNSMFRPCVSPVTYTGLRLGTHTFRVRHASGNGAVASQSWTVVSPRRS